MTAVFAGNDFMALGVLHALHESGRRVPDDVSVVGFDDVPQAAYYWPALTTVAQDFSELGRRALAVALAAVRGDDGTTVDLIEPELLVGDRRRLPAPDRRAARRGPRPSRAARRRASSGLLGSRQGERSHFGPRKLRQRVDATEC